MFNVFCFVDFLKEAEDRRLLLNDPEKAITFLDSLNTFEGLTLSFGCKKNTGSNCENMNSELFKTIIFPPIFAFEFHENKVLEDALSIFWHFLMNSHFTHHEKPHEKVNFFYKLKK